MYNEEYARAVRKKRAAEEARKRREQERAQAERRRIEAMREHAAYLADSGVEFTDMTRKDAEEAVERMIAEQLRLEGKTMQDISERSLINRKSGMLRDLGLGLRFEPVKSIIMRVAIKHDLTAEDIVGRSRLRPIVKARHEAMREVYNLRWAMSLPNIGRCFNRDHTSILHAIQKGAAE